jgi:hypothetical protein
VRVLLAFVAGALLATSLTAEPAKFSGEFRINVEQGYNNASDGVRFLSLTRSEKAELDMLSLAGDANLPAMQFLLSKDKRKVQITIEDVEDRVLERIVR